MKSVPEVLRQGNYPATFLQLIPFEIVVAPLSRGSVEILLDDDFAFRLDAIQAEASGPAVAQAFAEIMLELPSGRRLTRNPVSLADLSGEQGGKAFVHFRHRFEPSDVIPVEVRNTHASQAITVRGVLYGHKLTTESRL